MPSTRGREDFLDVSAKTRVLSESVGVDESLRQFKLLEALRTGDTANIDQYLVPAAGKSGTESRGSDALILAVQCAELRTVQHVLNKPSTDPNSRDAHGNTALHLAAQQGRKDVVDLLMADDNINDTLLNNDHRQAFEVAANGDLALHMQVKRGAYIEKINQQYASALQSKDNSLVDLLENPRVAALLDMNKPDAEGNTALHNAVLSRDISRIQLLLGHGADPFPRNKRNKTPIDLTKDDRIKALFRNLPQRTMLNNSPNDPVRFSGHLKKWTNYKSGYKARWFVLENGVLSYYRDKGETETACRGSINMRIAKTVYPSSDKSKFDVIGREKNSAFHLKAAHPTEAKNWIWQLNQASRQAKDAASSSQPSKDLTGATIVTDSATPAIQINSPSSPQTGLGTGLASSFTPSIADSVSRGPITSRNHSRGEIGPLDDVMPSNMSATYSDAGSDYEETGTEDEPHVDSFGLTANSAKIQLELMDQICERFAARPEAISKLDGDLREAIGTFKDAAHSLREMLSKLVVMASDRERHFKHLIDREQEMRRLWEDNMQALATDQDDLERKVYEAHQQRRATVKQLRAAQTQLKSLSADSPLVSPDAVPQKQLGATAPSGGATYINDDLLDDDDTDDEFYDAEASAAPTPAAAPEQTRSPSIQPFTETSSLAGASTIVDEPVAAAAPPKLERASISDGPASSKELARIKPAFQGYEHPIRTDMGRGDDRPTVSLWGILKSMIGKDMTKMTLPVSFNEATSLLQRVAEDMEYTDLLDQAAVMTDASTRALYVAAFAASEYASTIDRVAKPFNPLLHETYEYCRPDKQFRFMVEQVSHHPPIGAAHAESPNWEYWGESSVKSKFNGKSFDINPLGTWYLRLKLADGTEELYTWKKVNTAVVGILLGSPTVDNYGPMVVKNHTNGVKAELDFKARGWRGAGAYKVDGTVVDEHGQTRYLVAGKWNERLSAKSPNGDKALDVWQANTRPSGVPFNLTTFAMSLNYLDAGLVEWLPQTDTRLRPDQRAMEEGKYDFAATEKNRLEEKQRATRRKREREGVEPQARWFKSSRHPVTGEQYWQFTGDYWKQRAEAKGKQGQWDGVEDIFSERSD